jgi:glycosyltransferase involved in cell wall biosynthesis
VPAAAEARTWLAAAIAAASGSGGGAPPAAPSDGVRAYLAESARVCPEPPAPADLVARPAPLPPAQWHQRRLEALVAAPAPGPGAAARLAYHARWLGHLLWPDEPDWRPRISVVIAVYNRAVMAAEAVQSALALRWSPLEVIVVDDGSTDELERALAPFRDCIRLWRQPNRGVANARNRGVALATGELVNFLDSDNLLDPDAGERWIAAFRLVPDAAVCFAEPRLMLEDGAVGNATRVWPTGGPGCPTRDLLEATCAGHPFLNVGALTARFEILAAGPFDESLAYGEDTRFWFQLALRGAKAIGLRDPLNTRRFLRSGLTASRAHPERAQSAVPWLNLIDVLRTPAAWSHLPSAIGRLWLYDRWAAFDASDDPRAESLRDELIAEVERLGRLSAAGSPSARPVLRLLRAFTREIEERAAGSSGDGRLQARIVAALERSLERSPAPGPVDLEHWLPHAGDLRLAEALRDVAAAADASARRGEPWAPFARLLELRKLAPDVATKRRWKTLARLEAVAGPTATRRLLRAAGPIFWRSDASLRAALAGALLARRARAAAWRLNGVRRRLPPPLRRPR